MTGVPSHPEGEREPSAAKRLAGDRIEVLRMFVRDLEQRGEELGLIGPLELPRLWTRHILNSAVVAPLLTAGTTIADIGTGGGMPGLVLGIIRPDIQWKLIEPMERRCIWLQEQVERCELQNVSVCRGRAEEYHGAWEVDAVTARAVTALQKLIPMTAPLVKRGGEMLFLKGVSVEKEIDAAAKAIRKYHVYDISVTELGEEHATEITRVFRARVGKYERS